MDYLLRLYLLVISLFLLGVQTGHSTTWSSATTVSTTGQNSYISSTGQNASAPVVAINSAGQAIAVWQNFNGYTTTIYAATLLFGSTWSSPVAISFIGQNCSLPQIALNDSGRAVAVWQATVGSLSVIQGASFSFSSFWSAPMQFSSIGVNGVSPQVAINSSGAAMAVWEVVSGAASYIQASYAASPGAWGSPATLSPTTQNAVVPQVAINASGQAVAVWQNSVNGVTMIQGSTYASGSWSSRPATITSSGYSGTSPQVALNNAGQAVVVWAGNNGTSAAIQSSTVTIGGSWSSPASLSALANNGALPEVAINSSGQAVAVAQSSNFLSFGGSWNSGSNFAQSSQTALTSSVSMNAIGELVAVWSSLNGTNSIVQAASAYFGGLWSSPVTLSGSGLNALYPAVSINASGKIVAVWQSSNGSNTSIQAASATF